MHAQLCFQRRPSCDVSFIARHQAAILALDRPIRLIINRLSISQVIKPANDGTQSWAATSCCMRTSESSGVDNCSRCSFAWNTATMRPYCATQVVPSSIFWAASGPAVETRTMTSSSTSPTKQVSWIMSVFSKAKITNCTNAGSRVVNG